MRILFVSNCYPWPLVNGMYQRVYHLVEALARRHRVTLVVPLSSERLNRDLGNSLPLRDICEHIIEVDTYSSLAESSRLFHYFAPLSQRLQAFFSSPLPCMARRWMTNEVGEALKEIKHREKFDLVWAERPCMGELARAVGFKNIVVDIDDIESVSLRRLLIYSSWYRSKPLHYAELAKLYAYERMLARRFWRLAVCKEEDRQFFGRDRDDVFVVPNGVPSFPSVGHDAEVRGEMLFVGSMSYYPNIDAVQYLHSSILPGVRAKCPDAYLSVVGTEPAPSILALDDGTTCIVHGEVPDVTPYFATASLLVAPIRLGSGTRIKVLEALARGKAVVATTTAVEGLDLRPGLDIEIADSPEAFTAICVRLLNDPQVRQKLAISGRQRVLERYSWDMVGKSVERVLTADSGDVAEEVDEGQPYDWSN